MKLTKLSIIKITNAVYIGNVECHVLYKLECFSSFSKSLYSDIVKNHKTKLGHVSATALNCLSVTTLNIVKYSNLRRLQQKYTQLQTPEEITFTTASFPRVLAPL